MVNLYFLAGGYYSGAILTYLFNTDASTISLVSQKSTQSPTWFQFSRFNRTVLYSSNEFYQGAVQTWTVSSTGVLTGPVATLSSGGASVVHIAQLASGKVAAVNYESGSGVIADTTSDRLHFGSSQTFKFTGSPSHPHQAYEYNSEVLIPDLGQDKIWRVAQNSAGTWGVQGFIPQPKGSGPRHILISDGILYTVGELGSSLTVQPVPSAPNGTSTITSTFSTIPPDAPPNGQWAASEILLPETTSAFPTPYIYVSNRNKATANADSRGDTIAIYTKPSAGQSPVLIKHVYTGLNEVRGMQFTSDGLYLVAAGAGGSKGVAVFKRVSGGTDLQLVARNSQQTQLAGVAWV